MRLSRPCGVAVLVGSLAALAACGPNRTATDTPPNPNGDTTSPVEPKPIPATVDAARIAPSEGNAPDAKSLLIDYMAAENGRWIEALRAAPEAPAYYLAYQIHEQRRVLIDTQGGSLTSYDDTTERYLDVVVRVGSPALDNMRPLADPRDAFLNMPGTRRGRIPLDENELAVKKHLWLETDRRYREATLALRQVKTDVSLSAAKNSAPDFVHAEPVTYYQKPAELTFDKDAWVDRLRACSKKAYRGKATRGGCSAQFELNTVYYVNSEGTQLQLSWPSAQLLVSVGVKADDGQPLTRIEQRFAPTPAELPSDTEVDQMIDAVTADLDALWAAPLADPYAGPAILEGRAAAVFFHEVFGHRIEGHRQTDDTSGQTFTSYVGSKIMPEWLTVYDDPTLRSLNGVTLNGFYRYDDEGVMAQRAKLVENGVLVGFIQGRDPIEGFPNSNGHGRKEPGNVAVSRQGNLVVEAAKSVTQEELYEQLITEVKRQGKPFGLIVSDISGGFTQTTRFEAQHFKVNPVMVYRLYPDGRKELVRGVDLVGTPLTAIGNIISAGRPVETFNGMCGAESGWVPVSASAPSLLLQSLETERGYTPQDRPPILPPPSIRNRSTR
jgi:TldD protein